MRRGTWADDPTILSTLSTRGVIGASTLRSLEVAPGTIVHRTRVGGPWQRILPGLVLLSNAAPSMMQRVTAAMMYGGDEAVLTGHAGLGLHGYGRAATINETLILLPHAMHRKDCGFLTVERTWRMPEPILRSGIRVAPIARCMTDAARRSRDALACTALFADGVQRGDVTTAELMNELNDGSSRGTAMPRRVLRELGDNAHSVAELSAQKLYARSGLPPMIFNATIDTLSGEFVLIADGWLDEVALGWEIESFQHHSSPADYEKTLLRRANAQSTGIIIVAHVPKTIRDNPNLVLSDLRKGYELALSRPRPDVRVRVGS